MKIGILTVPFNNNYGGFLQAYALTTVLKRMGHEVVVINRRRNRSRRAKIRALFSFVIPDKQEKLKEKISVNTQKFVSEHIKLTKPLFSSSAMRREYARQKFDCLIVGSDQVWRYRYARNSICDYFFGFLEKSDNTPRFSYAASFGVDFQEYPTEYLERCANYLKQFKGLSVREETAVNLLNQYFNVSTHNIHVVADPTLLLGTDDYQQLFSEYKSATNDSYTFEYVLDETEDTKCIVQEVIEVLDLPVIQMKAQTGNIENNDVIEPIEKWLSSIAGASYVITDSYHGTVFSILFNRPFVVIVNPTRGITRVEYLLRHFGLSNRMLSVSDSKTISEVMSSSINWFEINKTIALDRENALGFIANNL